MEVTIQFLLRFRKIQQLGLAKDYAGSSSEIGKWFHHLFGLTFLAAAKIEDAYEFDFAPSQITDVRISNYIDNDMNMGRKFREQFSYNKHLRVIS